MYRHRERSHVIPDQVKTSFITDQGIYCYKVMLFDLKNVGACQRLVNVLLATKLGKRLKSTSMIKPTTTYLRYNKNSLSWISLAWNSTRPIALLESLQGRTPCNWERDQRKTKIDRGPHRKTGPRSACEVQRLTRNITAFNRFISRSNDKCHPFYQLLNENKKFQWRPTAGPGRETNATLPWNNWRLISASPPILSKALEGETLYLYVADYEVAVSSVLNHYEENEQNPVYYVRKLLIKAKTRYPAVEKLALAVVRAAWKLRPYLQSHSILVMISQPYERY